MLGYKIRYSLVFGETPDISAYLMFMLWDKVRYLVKTIKFPKNPELPGRFLGVASDVGDQLTYRIVPDAPDNKNPFVLSWSVVEADDGRNKICNSQRKIGIKKTLKRYAKRRIGKRRSPRLRKTTKHALEVINHESDPEEECVWEATGQIPDVQGEYHPDPDEEELFMIPI